MALYVLSEDTRNILNLLSTFYTKCHNGNGEYK